MRYSAQRDQAAFAVRPLALVVAFAPPFAFISAA
jgi:hypothetical protein